ncbi:MAG: serine/threonine-protein kinase [Myxococcota bacterium]
MTSDPERPAPDGNRVDLRPRPPPDQRRRAKARAHRALFGTSLALAPSEPDGSSPTEAERELQPGDALGRYVVGERLGHGGMGTVFEALDPALGRTVAIKVLRGANIEEHAARLRREARALAKLSHPHVVHVYEVAQAEGSWFIAMERLSGRTLRTWQEEEGPDWRRCIEAYLQAAAGLEAAHAAGLVHRDFKPDNCIIDARGWVRVLDFGLVHEAKAAVSEGHEVTTADGEPDSPADLKTRTGALLGTVAYMSPEQRGRRPADARSDQFSFCVSLYEACYGQRPFATEPEEIRSPPRGTTVPVALHRLLLRGLATDPSARWPSMGALTAALKRVVAPPRRGRWLAAAAVVGGLGVWLALGRGEDETRCRGGHDDIAQVWNEDRARRLEQRITDTGLSYAPQTWSRVRRHLDTYAQQWAQQHRAACEATSVRHEQSPAVMDLRMSCLRRHRAAMNETVGLLLEADAAGVKQATTLTSKLPDPSTCADIERLRADLPAPHDPALARRVEALRERLVRVGVLDHAGAYDEAVAEAEAVLRDARSVDYAPLRAEALLQRGRQYQRVARYDDATRDLERAYTEATTLGHERVELQAVTTLVFVVGVQQNRLDSAEQWGKTALALADGGRVEAFARANAWLAMGIVLERRGRLESSLEHQRRALEILTDSLGIEHPFAAIVMDSIGTLLAAQGRYDEALDFHRRALAVLEGIHGPKHPEVGVSLSNIGLVLKDQRKLPEALEHHRQALAILEPSLGADHPFVANTLTSIGTVLHHQGDHRAALEHHRRALAIYEQSPQDHALTIAIVLGTVAVTLDNLGELERAMDSHRRSAEVLEQILGPEHPHVAVPLHNIGGLLRRAQRYDEARDSYRRALEIRERALGPEHPSVATTLSGLANVERDHGRIAEATAHYRRALAIKERALGPHHPRVAFTLVGLALLELEEGQLESAQAHAARAVEIREDAAVASDLLAETHFTLARIQWEDPAGRPRARALAQQAHDEYAAEGPEHAEDRAEIARWLAERAG